MRPPYRTEPTIPPAEGAGLPGRRGAILTVGPVEKEVRPVASRETPTNDRIVALLHDVLRELKELAVRQERIETSLATIAKTTR